jgi:cytochrome c-type biogenesis protein CcmH/NrfG
MGKKTTGSNDTVKKQTLVTSVVISVMVGFFLGVVFGVYKSSGRLPAGAEGIQADADGRERMLQVLTEKVVTNPDDGAAWVQLGNLHFDSDRPKEAIGAYEKALALEPGNAMVLTDLGIMYRRSGNPEEAVRRFDQAIEADPALENPYYNKGVVLFHDLNDHQAAIRAWEALLKMNPMAKAPNGQAVKDIVAQHRETTEQ